MLRPEVIIYLMWLFWISASWGKYLSVSGFQTIVRKHKITMSPGKVIFLLNIFFYHTSSRVKLLVISSCVWYYGICTLIFDSTIVLYEVRMSFQIWMQYWTWSLTLMLVLIILLPHQLICRWTSSLSAMCQNPKRRKAWIASKSIWTWRHVNIVFHILQIIDMRLIDSKAIMGPCG